MLSTEEKEELCQLLEERTMSDWERRRRRLLAAQARLFGVDKHGMPSNDGVGELLERARKGMPLSDDQYAVINLGFLPGE